MLLPWARSWGLLARISSGNFTGSLGSTFPSNCGSPLAQDPWSFVTPSSCQVKLAPRLAPATFPSNPVYESRFLLNGCVPSYVGPGVGEKSFCVVPFKKVSRLHCGINESGGQGPSKSCQERRRLLERSFPAESPDGRHNPLALTGVQRPDTPPELTPQRRRLLERAAVSSGITGFGITSPTRISPPGAPSRSQSPTSPLAKAAGEIWDVQSQAIRKELRQRLRSMIHSLCLFLSFLTLRHRSCVS